MSALGVRRLLWWSAWLGVGALLVLVWTPDGADAATARSRSPIERLLGPVASLGASIQWVRFDAALQRGETARAYARAENALRLAPGDAWGWIFLARHLAYERGSVLREPDKAARARWVEAGLATLRRGEELARDRGALRFERGILLAFQASLSDEERAFPRGEAEAWRLAAESFEAAATDGAPGAAQAAALARERIPAGR